MSQITKRSILTLFSGLNDVKSHMVRIVLYSKGVAYEIEKVTNNVNSDLLDVNPYGNVPTIVDHDLAINDLRIIIDYLDDRFPHPSLYPAYPDQRAKFRIILKELEKSLFDKIELLTDSDPKIVEETSFDIIKYLNTMIPLIDPHSFYVMDEEFSIIDCYLAPIMHRILRVDPTMRDHFPTIMQEYQRRIFSRENFINSMSIRNSRGFMAEKDK